MFLGLLGPAHVRAAITQFYVPCLYLFICKTLLCLLHARVSAKERSNGAAAAGAEKRRQSREETRLSTRSTTDTASVKTRAACGVPKAAAAASGAGN